MHVRILIFFIVFLLFSCGKDVVEIVDTPIPNQPNEIFEVNLVGFVMDQNRNFIANADLYVNNESIETENSSFFKADNIFLGNAGQVIGVEKDDFLPNYKRIYNHQTLEDVIVNVSLMDAPEGQPMTPSGGDLISENGSVLSFGVNSVMQDVDVMFYSSINNEDRIDFDPLIITENRVEILGSDVLFYVGTNEEDIVSNITFEINAEAVTNSEYAKLYRYNETALTWEENGSISTKEDMIHADINSEGWWAIGNGIAAVFGSTKFNQQESVSGGKIPLVNAEVEFMDYDNGSSSSEHLFTSNEGVIYKYYPIDMTQKIEFDNEEVFYDLEGFSSSDNEVLLELDQQLRYNVSGESYDCNIEKQKGYVVVIFGDHFVIKRIESGVFDLSVALDKSEVDFDFYDESENLLLSKKIETDKITGATIRFVACEPLMEVKDENTIVKNFDQCKVRVKPVESFIVGEGVSDEKVFVAFKGNEVGEYEGLVFAEAVASMDVTNIESEVALNVLIYDLISETIAGTVAGAYRSGESYSVKFIGKIEN